MDLDLAAKLQQPAESKVVLCVLDGLGGMARPETERSELEQSDTPNLDRLTETSDVGLTIPVGIGITPGSGPGHLSLFGYDPYRFDIGRGVLEAVGIDFELGPDDVAARGNFCTLDADGNVSDRRAGRIASELSAAIVERLRTIELDGAELFVEPVREHRFVLVLRAPDLQGRPHQTDPSARSVRPSPPRRRIFPPAERSPPFVQRFRRRPCAPQRREAARPHPSRFRHSPLPQSEDAGAFARRSPYPMYRGLASSGMRRSPAPGAWRSSWPSARDAGEFDYFFHHYRRPTPPARTATSSPRSVPSRNLIRTSPDSQTLAPTCS